MRDLNKMNRDALRGSPKNDDEDGDGLRQRTARRRDESRAVHKTRLVSRHATSLVIPSCIVLSPTFCTSKSLRLRFAI